MTYQPGYEPHLSRYGQDEPRHRHFHIKRGVIVGLLLMLFVVSLGGGAVGSAIVCPC